MARQEAFGDRLPDQGCGAETRGEALVNYVRTIARRIAFVLAACLVMMPLASTPSHAAAKVQHLISPGGIEAWFVQDSTVPLIAMEYAFGGGATQDPADKPGVGNMAANLLDEGSGDLDSKTFHERLERRAIELSFSSARDNFRGSLRMLRDNREEAFDLLRMALTSPRFDSSDVERIRAQVMWGLRRETSNPNSLASRKLLETAFGNHPYGRPGNGTLDSVPRIDVADLKDYVRRVLARDTLRIAVVGDVDPAALGKLLDQTFGGLPAKASLAPVADVEATKPPQRAFIPLDVPQTVVTFGGPGFRRSDPNFMAGYVRGSIARFARSAVLPIRSMNRFCGWIIPRCSSEIPEPALTAPGRPSTPSARKSAAWPRMARPSRSWTRPSPISRARKCWRSIPRRSWHRRCCNTSSIGFRSTTSRSATPSSMQCPWTTPRRPPSGFGGKAFSL